MTGGKGRPFFPYAVILLAFAVLFFVHTKEAATSLASLSGEYIYREVEKRDKIWKLVPKDHAVKVRFEKALTKEDDITFYARGGGRIEIYEEGKEEPFASVEASGEERRYEVPLTGFQGKKDTFLIKVNDNLEFDYIVDPSGDTNFWTCTSTNYFNTSACWSLGTAPVAGEHVRINGTTMGDINMLC